MNRVTLLAALLLLLVTARAQAAEKYFSGYNFQATISSPQPCTEEFSRSGANLIRVKEGQEYSITVYNPLPVRVAAAVTIDGLNSIDGKRSTPDAAQKWMIEPYSSITISGWQTSDSSSRKFYFTTTGDSYAKWKGKRDKKDYTSNVGIIGVAYFWNNAELQAAITPPAPFLRSRPWDERQEYDLREGAAAGSAAKSLSSADRAGTGMGERQWHPVTRVEFTYDTGMYRASDALVIRYEFAPSPPSPLPFEEPEHEYRYRSNYAPEM